MSDAVRQIMGGTGFVGRRLVEALGADGAAVTMLDRGARPWPLTRSEES